MNNRTENSSIKLYKYRWMVLTVYFLITAVIEIQWILLAPITGDAAKFYNVSEIRIGLLSMIFMITYIIISIPVSYIIDTYGIRKGVGTGAVLTGIFGMLKGLFPESFTMMCIAQTGLAVAQPFILNACTRVAADWFPINERATASGIATLGQYAGIIAVMETVPRMLPSHGIPGIARIFGYVTFALAVAFIIIIRDKPPTPPCHAGHEHRMDAKSGFIHVIKQPGMVYLLILFFIGLGMFNAITTWIEQIIGPRNFSAIDAGNLATAMFTGGIIGASVLSPLSDRLRKRKPFLIACMLFSIPGLIGITFATIYSVLMVSGFILGFFIMSAGPIGFQYAAEISYPAPESTSQGLIVMSGQVSGILFIAGMDMFRYGGNGSMTPSMVTLIILSLAGAGLCFRLRESEVIKTDL